MKLLDLGTGDETPLQEHSALNSETIFLASKLVFFRVPIKAIWCDSKVSVRCII